MGLEDELRVVLRARGSVWGYMCLHREHGSAFSAEEVAFTQRIAPHLADGLRLGLLVQGVESAQLADSPGLILLAADGSVLGKNTAANQWLDELNLSGTRAIPDEVHALAARLYSLGPSVGVPQLRTRTRAGRWAILNASWMPSQGRDAVAVIIQQATADQVVPVVMSAYGLTEQERTISGLVFRGLSTRAISERLHITQHTVQDHMKSIFDKTGSEAAGSSWRRFCASSTYRERRLASVRAHRVISPMAIAPRPYTRFRHRAVLLANRSAHLQRAASASRRPSPALIQLWGAQRSRDPRISGLSRKWSTDPLSNFAGLGVPRPPFEETRYFRPIVCGDRRVEVTLGPEVASTGAQL